MAAAAPAIVMNAALVVDAAAAARASTLTFCADSKIQTCFVDEISGAI